MNGLSQIYFYSRKFALVLNMSLEYTQNFGLKIENHFWTLPEHCYTECYIVSANISSKIDGSIPSGWFTGAPRSRTGSLSS